MDGKIDNGIYIQAKTYNKRWKNRKEKNQIENLNLNETKEKKEKI